MKPINYSWPVIFSSDFKKDEVKENFSRGKLKVFYKGETADHRLFSDEFSEQLISSLPYTPVVSHFDAEKDDFVGHASQQDIYGIVDPCTEPTFEEDGDNTWCVCDVVLYTERPDQTGDIAKKIIGHSQSLELDPKTVKYRINYDEKKHFKNIEFTAGTFVGVSVLGKDQKPAFTGSSFFVCDENFNKKMELLKNYCEHKDDQETVGGNQMNILDFMKLSWGEIAQKVGNAIDAEYGSEYYCLPVDFYDDNVVFRAYSYFDGSSKLFRIFYQLNDNNEVSLGAIEEVHVVYEKIEEPQPQEPEGVNNATVEETDTTNSTENAAESVENLASTDDEPTTETPEEPEFVNNSQEDLSSTEPETIDGTEPTDYTVAPEFTEEPISEGGDAATNSENADPAANEFSADDTQTQKVDGGDDESIQETDSSSTTFTESEGAELEANRQKEEKVKLLDNYKESLSDDEYNKFMESIDSYTTDSLTLDLLNIFKEKADDNKPAKRKIRPLAFGRKNNANDESVLYDYIKGHLN